MSHFLFPDIAEAKSRGTSVHPKATFELYESEALEAVGLASQFRRPEHTTLPFEKLAQPVFLPRPFAINEVQALAVRLALVQYYCQRGWTLGMSDAELGATCLPPDGKRPHEYARGFIIGDGTGVGKTREIAAFAVSAIMAERAVQETGLRHHTVNIGGGWPSLWSRQPLFVWLTCSESLFESCKEDLRAVLVNSDTTPGGSWRLAGFPDAPSSYDPSLGLTVVDHNGHDMFIKFTTLKRLKEDMTLSSGVVTVPTVLFMTYAGLTVNLEQALSLLVGGGRPIMESKNPIAPVVTAIFCDEFHKPKAISDAYRKELAEGWEREDRAVFGQVDEGRDSTAPSAIVWRFCRAMSLVQKAKRIKRGRAQVTKDEVVSTFLADLGQADSFRMLVELTKRNAFYLMASATPFQSNDDLHSIDHLVRNLLPAYTGMDAFNCNVDPKEAAELVESGEYATQFLEDLVKLLHNQGRLVSRAISMAHVECAVVRCPMSPMHTQAVDGLASYMSETKMALATSAEIGRDLAAAVDDLAVEQKREGWSAVRFRERLDGMVESVNRVGSTTAGPLSRLAPFFRAVVVDDRGLWFSGAASATDESTITEGVFDDKYFGRLATQITINLAGMSVAVCKATLLSIKTKAVADAVQRLRRSPKSHKVVVAIEQTGDAFLGHLVERMCDALVASSGRPREKNKKRLLNLGDFETSPVANAVLSVYRLLCQGVAIRSAVRVLPLANSHTCLLLVPRLPPVWPLVAIGGNFLDVVEQSVGESRHSEITNRRFKCRWSRNGLLVVGLNAKSANTLKSVDAFNNNTQVDVMVLGPKGNTGLSLHDSRTNAVAARRIHFVADLPYNPVAFRQCVGRTHRNGQASTPAFLIFSTDAAAERRFFDCLERRIKDSTAGSFGDRYSKNTLDMAAAETIAEVSDVSDGQRETNKGTVDREQFLDHGLSLRVIGHLIRIVVSDTGPLDLFAVLGQMGLYESERFVFVEGLDSENGLFVETLTLGLNVVSAVLTKGRLSVETLLASSVRPQTLVAVMRAAGSVIDSNLVESVVCESREIQLSQSLLRLKTAATQLFYAVGMTKNADMRAELLNGTKTGTLRLPGSKMPEPRITTGPRVVTVRVIGASQTAASHILPAVGRVIPSEVIENLPLVGAVCVLSRLTVECPSLILRTLKAATPHARSWGGPVSFVLNIARRLAAGKLDSRQFHNSYFSSMVDAALLKDLFSVVRHIMARDSRLDTLCDTRVNPVVMARYTTIHRAPTSATKRRDLLGSAFTPHISRDLLDDDDRVDGVEESRFYRVDAQLADGTVVTLTPENSIFVNCYLDYFIVKNVTGYGGCVVQLRFENHRQMHLPPMALLGSPK